MATTDVGNERTADAVRAAASVPLDPAPQDVRTGPGGGADSPADWVQRGSARVVDAWTDAQDTGSRGTWLTVAAECQALVNTLTAVQDLAVVEVARRESSWGEDGTLGEDVHRPGAVTLDAADLVAPALGASHEQAQRRVEQAVRLAAARVPVEADRGQVPQSSGLGGLHAAMAAGRLDGFRAGVVAHELHGAPAHVADAVVTALDDHLG